MEADRQILDHHLMNSYDAPPEILTAEISELESLWGEARSGWNDRVAEDFELQVIAPLQSTIRDLSNTLTQHSSTLS